jgi:hypothetical protein
MIAAKDAVMEHVLSLHKAAQPMHEPTVQRVLEKVRVQQSENDDDNADQYARDVEHFCCKTSDRNQRRQCTSFRPLVKRKSSETLTTFAQQNAQRQIRWRNPHRARVPASHVCPLVFTLDSSTRIKITTNVCELSFALPMI